MLVVRGIFDAGKAGKGSAIYRGQKIIGYREWVADVRHWHALVVLADGTRINLDEVK
jgi:hypothetical protein